MAIVLFVLAFAALAAGVWLWFAGDPAPGGSGATKTSGRDRRAWAAANRFEYVKRDESLVGEWTRGAASGGAAATHAAAGSSFGHATHLVDLGGTTVMAMQTGEVSDITVAAARGEHSAELPTDLPSDLIAVAEHSGFTIAATEPGPVQRFIDARVTTALAELPPAVHTVWFERDWVVAEFAPGAAPRDWDAALAPLALLADAARTLPPADPKPLHTPLHTPLRAPAPARTPQSTPAAQTQPQKVARPEEPLELPTRTTGTTRGPAQEHVIGEQAADAGDGGIVVVGERREARSPDETDLTRARRAPKPPSIFDEPSEGEPR